MQTDEGADTEPARTPSSGPMTRRGFLLAGAGFAVGAAATGAVERMRRPGPASAMEKLFGLEHRTTSDRRRLHAHPDAIFGVETSERVVGLSFDDGPDGRYTAHVLDGLADRGVTATFFLVGTNALAHPDLVARIVAEGHSIGNHTRSHRALDRLDQRDAFEEILGGAADIAEAGGGSTGLFRPPYGYSEGPIGSFTTASGVETVFWSMSVEKHLAGVSVDEGVASIVDGVHPGDLLLAHDGSGAVDRAERERSNRSPTVAALPGILDGLVDRGFRVADVPGLLEAGPRRGVEGLRR